MAKEKDKSLESWIWDAACSIRGARDAPKYKDYILPLIFTRRLCDVFDDEINRIAAEVGSRKKAFQLARADHKLVRFYLPLLPDDPEQPVWSVIRKLADKIGEGVTTHMRAIAKENPLLQGIIDRVDFNATTHGQRDIDDDRLSNLIEAISTKRLGLKDVEADIIGKSYEYLIRKFAEGGNIGDPEQLLEIACATGLSRDEASVVLAKRTFREVVDLDWERSRSVGVTGVPTYVAAGLGVVGAQPYERLEELVQKAGAQKRAS